jgi:hypothetical protein
VEDPSARDLTVPELNASPQPTPQPTQLFIVRRGRESTFRLLERQFGNDPSVRIIWDRRYEERRRSTQAAGGDRRHRDRRAPAPITWPSINYLVVNIK